MMEPDDEALECGDDDGPDPEAATCRVCSRPWPGDGLTICPSCDLAEAG